MQTAPTYDPIDPRYYDEKDLRSEVERIFNLCSDCRLCNKFCGSFPKLFDAVDSYCTDEKYAEVDIKKFTAEDAKTVAKKTTDPTEFLASLASQGKLNRDFKTNAGKVAYHMPCHLRAQNIGYKTRDVLSLLPDTKVEVIEACSGHDGTWAMKKENFAASLKWGGKAFRDITSAEPDVSCSDCPMAAIQIQQGTGRKPLNPIEILARSYRGEQIISTD